MASVNKVIIVGNLGRDPETRAFPSGDQICNIRVATTDKWKDKQTGEAREHTEWHSIVFNGRLAEIAAQYLRKGSQVYIEGSLRTRKWQDQSGADRYSTEIRADTMQMLGSRQGMGGEGGGYGGGDSGFGGAPRRAPVPQAASTRAPAADGYDDFAATPTRAPSPPPMRAPVQAPPPVRQDTGFNNMDDDIPF